MDIPEHKTSPVMGIPEYIKYSSVKAINILD